MTDANREATGHIRKARALIERHLIRVKQRANRYEAAEDARYWIDLWVDYGHDINRRNAIKALGGVPLGAKP